METFPKPIKKELGKIKLEKNNIKSDDSSSSQQNKMKSPKPTKKIKIDPMNEIYKATNLFLH